MDLVPEGDSLWVKVKVGRELLKYIVPKGFTAIDATSLTVVDVFDEELCFNFMLVAYMQQKVVIPLKKVWQKVNLEVDILGKRQRHHFVQNLCDACRHPNIVSKYLEELTSIITFRHRNGSSQLYISSWIQLGLDV